MVLAKAPSGMVLHSQVMEGFENPAKLFGEEVLPGLVVKLQKIWAVL
jgi:hypothetical protein